MTAPSTARSSEPSPQPQPLTDAQLGLWYAQQRDPSNPVFNTAQYVEIRGRLDVQALGAAVQQAMAEADALAVRIVDTDTGPRQTTDAQRRVSLHIVDLRQDTDPASAAHVRMQADIQTPLDPCRDQLVAQQLFILADDSYFWYQRIHHLLVDGYGTALLTQRIADLYSAYTEHVAGATSRFGVFAAVLDAERTYHAGPQHDADRAFWTTQLKDAPAAGGLASGAAVTADRYLSTALALPASIGPTLRAIAANLDVPWPDLLTALIAAYVSRHVNETDVTVGMAAMGRLGTPAARVPAMVMNILPLRVQVDEDRPLTDWLRETSATFRRARRHGRYRSEQLRRELNLLGGERRLYGPLVNVLPFDEPPRFADLDATLHILATGPVDDLTVTIRTDADLERMRAELDANPRLYTADALAEHGARLAAFIDHALVAERLADVPTVTPDEHAQLLHAFNDTAHAVDDSTLVALIERTIERTPAAPALVFGTQTLSYAELDDRSRRLSVALHRAGVRRGDLVGVALPRLLELVIALHAILRIGAAYLPLDVEQPAARLERITRAAEPRLIVATQDTRPYVRDYARVLDVLEPVDVNMDADDLSAPAPSDAAYVIFTSGSTGDPKGVVVEHRAIVNRLAWMQAQYQVGTGDRILQKTPMTFDVSVWEFFLPLVAGATLVVAPPDAHRDPRQLAELLHEHQISLVHFVPSMLEEFLSEPLARTAPMRAVFCSGEALPAALRDRFHTLLEAELHNLYGPTEAAVDVTYWEASPADRSEPVPIGRPVWNTRLYVLDTRDRLVPAGVAGHLHLAGVQLAREYLGRPDLTADRFVADPFDVPGQRMYRTGDLARWRADGAVEFLGRSDHQVKIRGQRIELGEIDAAIVASGLVVRSLVTTHAAAAGDTRIVAYVQPAAPGRFDVAALRHALASSLPDVMLPASIVVVDEWPTTSNGKLDRTRLPTPNMTAAAGRSPSTPTERQLAALMAGVLNIAPDEVSADADFFALGGHSLLAAQLVRRIRAEGHGDVSLGTVFTHTTVAALAAHLDTTAPQYATDETSGPDDLSITVRLRQGPVDRPLLACVHPAGGLAWCYGTLARTLTVARRVVGLQARGLSSTAVLPPTLDALAEDYVAALRTIQPDGPYHLAGWSIGGIIAQAMAARLEADGARVGVLAMFDAYPSDRWRSATDPDEAAALRALLLMAGERPERFHTTLTRASVIQTLREGDHPLGLLSDVALSGVLRAVEHNNRLVRRHRHQPCRAQLLHFKAALEPVNDTTSAEEWRAYVGGIEAHEIQALHAHMTGPTAARLIAARLDEVMA